MHSHTIQDEPWQGIFSERSKRINPSDLREMEEQKNLDDFIILDICIKKAENHNRMYPSYQFDTKKK